MSDIDAAEIERLVEQRKRAIATLKKFASLPNGFNGDAMDVLVQAPLIDEVRDLLKEIDPR